MNAIRTKKNRKGAAVQRILTHDLKLKPYHKTCALRIIETHVAARLNSAKTLVGKY